MQQINKLNGFPFKEFEDIGIKTHTLYRLAREKYSEKDILSKAFKKKYGDGGKLDSFNSYYSNKLNRCKNLKLYQRVEIISKIKTEYYKAGLLFNISESVLDYNWDGIVNSYLITL